MGMGWLIFQHFYTKQSALALAFVIQRPREGPGGRIQGQHISGRLGGRGNNGWWEDAVTSEGAVRSCSAVRRRWQQTGTKIYHIAYHINVSDICLVTVIMTCI